MVGDSFENIASLQDCHFQQRDSVQTLGETSSSGFSPRENNPNLCLLWLQCEKTCSAVHTQKIGAFKEFEWRTENLFFLLFPGVNTKQLANQMLDLTKVINELKDVLIQQVSTGP